MIEGLTPQDCDFHKIRTIVQEFDKTLSDEERAKCFVPDLSDKRFNENIAFFEKLAEELKAKKTRKSNSLAAKKINKKVDNCTVDDVK